LQLDGLSSWRLPTIEELHRIYDPSVNSHAKWDDEVRNDMHVKGNLRLSGWSWSSSFHRSSSQAKEHPISEAGVFAFTHEDPKGGGFPFDFSYNTRALCVRDSGDGKSAQVLTKGGQAFEAWDSTNAPQGSTNPGK
jgi:hypothetical protein